MDKRSAADAIVAVTRSAKGITGIARTFLELAEAAQRGDDVTKRVEAMVALSLKRCPNCGSFARFVAGRMSAGSRTRYSIHCSDYCGVEVLGDHEAEVRRKWAALCI